MGLIIEDGVRVQGYVEQVDATINQANPVSTTLYTVLDTTKNVEISSITGTITWATTQPTPLEVVATIDGQTIIYGVDNPVSGTVYYAIPVASNDEAHQALIVSGDPYPRYKAFLFQRRSVKIEARITWATTQPTPLVCRVKWAKIP